MNKDIGLKSMNIKKVANSLVKKYARHTTFAVILLILLSYIFVVFKISRLASAEPNGDQTPTQTLTIQHVDQKVIDHIKTLEDNNTQIHSLFEQARNNPFQQ
jgi:hypothetical protein